ncbi:MAG TPA: zinc-dependent alcohol dehydrogenase family protein [Acidobacteriota bacterium]|nr:zinc-dependent alcohol dehydrogenase family protein [Acidobacteriota bacterium]
MKAMVLEKPGQPLVEKQFPIPEPEGKQLLIEVEACAVCRTDLHVVDGELPEPSLPVIPGHEIIGMVRRTGPDTETIREGDRVGVPWLGWTCGECRFCRSGRENLCDRARFTGYTLPGGFAEFTIADERFSIPLENDSPAAEIAPFLCAGLIGYRCLRKTGDARKLGLYGFGAAAHIVIQIARHEGREVYAFTRPGDHSAQEFARSMGAVWAGDSDGLPPEELDAAIIFAPVGELVPYALRAVAKGGIVVCGGIHMSDIPSFPYEILWGERRIESVANLTRQDGIDFMEIAPKIPIRTKIEPFVLDQANQALNRLRSGQIEGAAVLIIR